jgi:hypothetical protein
MKAWQFLCGALVRAAKMATTQGLSDLAEVLTKSVESLEAASGAYKNALEAKKIKRDMEEADRRVFSPTAREIETFGGVSTFRAKVEPRVSAAKAKSAKKIAQARRGSAAKTPGKKGAKK